MFRRQKLVIDLKGASVNMPASSIPRRGVKRWRWLADRIGITLIIGSIGVIVFRVLMGF